MKFDDILKTVGEFGRYQRRLYLILDIFKFTISWAELIAVFINAPVDHWCATPEWDSGCGQYGMSAEACELAQKEGSIPSNYTSDGELEYAQCEKYNVSGVGFWPGMVPSNYSSGTMSCDSGWVFDHSKYKSTTISDFDLVCGEDNLAELSQSIFYIGIAVGSIFFGILSDKIGRWWPLLVSNFISLIAGLALAFSPNWWFFATMRFFMGFGNVALNTVLYVIGMEYIGTSKRNVIFLASISYAFGYMLLALPAYFIRSWRTLQLVMTAPLSILFIFFIWLPESPRWLISMGKYEKAEKVINRFAEGNRVTLPSPLFTKEFMEDQDQTRKAHKPTGLDLFRTPRMRLRTINLLCIWMVNSLVYHGLALNTSNLGIDIYLAFAISAAVEIPAYLLAFVIVEFFGRKLSLFGCMMLGGVACVSTAFIEHGITLTIVASIGKFGITASSTIIYLYTVELNPTNIRGVAVGNCAMFSNIAVILAPLVLILSKYWDPLPLVIYGSLSVLAALSALALPETRGKRLPETLEEGERFGLNTVDDKDHKDMTSEPTTYGLEEDDNVHNEYRNGTKNDVTRTIQDNPAFTMEYEHGHMKDMETGTTNADPTITIEGGNGNQKDKATQTTTGDPSFKIENEYGNKKGKETGPTHDNPAFTMEDENGNRIYMGTEAIDNSPAFKIEDEKKSKKELSSGISQENGIPKPE